MNRAKLAITMGDPAGIGAEIIVKSLNKTEVYDKCIPIVIGDYYAIKSALDFCNISLEINIIDSCSNAYGKFGTIDLINLDYLSENSWEYKKNSKICGEASFNYVTYGINLALKGDVDAVVTAPISKEAINLAGHNYSGHTEIFADYTNTKDFAMLLACGNLRVIHVTTHCALRDACNKIAKKRVLDVIKLADQGLKLLGVNNPKIAVAGLNPHCSENGLFGTEETNEIIPAIKLALAENINVEGPISPDTVFVKCMSGQYDIVVAMYHDQGHIPLKLSGFRINSDTGNFDSVSGINCTIGLPVIRTSVDHGTAFGKAGEGRANPDSLLDAIWAAVVMVENRKLNVEV